MNSGLPSKVLVVDDDPEIVTFLSTLLELEGIESSVATSAAAALEQLQQGAPDLVVEILSDSTRRRDETLKRHLYERFGVLEYWLVDPDSKTVRVYHRLGARFLAPQEFSAAISARS